MEVFSARCSHLTPMCAQVVPTAYIRKLVAISTLCPLFPLFPLISSRMRRRAHTQAHIYARAHAHTRPKNTYNVGTVGTVGGTPRARPIVSVPTCRYSPGHNVGTVGTWEQMSGATLDFSVNYAECRSRKTSHFRQGCMANRSSTYSGICKSVKVCSIPMKDRENQRALPPTCGAPRKPRPAALSLAAS